jgi:hypothetical protein
MVRDINFPIFGFVGLLFADRAGVTSSAGSTYRLSEWLLVRLAEQYGTFLNHTPWFRFPYVSFLWMTWKIFFNEFAIVLSAHGIGEAFSNYGFRTSSVVSVA